MASSTAAEPREGNTERGISITIVRPGAHGEVNTASK